MRLPDGYSARPASWDDLDAVVDVFKACDRADVGFEDPVREHIEDDWRAPGFELARDATVLVASDGSVAAYGTVGGLNHELSIESFGRVHPEHRGLGLGEALVDWSESRALELSPGVPVLKNTAPAEDHAAHELFERHGYTGVRTFWHMERGLGDGAEPAVPPPGILIRSFEQATDVKALHDALEEAFQDHWDSEPYPYERHEADLAQADPDLVSLAFDEDALVGGAMARMVEGTGWIDVVGVRPAWRRRGVAGALLLRSFGALAERGAPNVMLNVDSESLTGAPGVYARVGMRVHRAWRAFEKRLVAD